MAMDYEQISANSKEQLNILFENMFVFDDGDMEHSDTCFYDVFKKGVQFSFMSATFYAQFAAELLIGLLASDPLRKLMAQAIDEEKAAINEPVEYWNETMKENRFGIIGRDYKNDIKSLNDMMNTSYNKIKSLGTWFGTPEGKKEFEDSYPLTPEDMTVIKRIICEFPYLFRKYDHDEAFAKEVTEYAGIVANQIKQTAKGKQEE